MSEIPIRIKMHNTKAGPAGISPRSNSSFIETLISTSNIDPWDVGFYPNLYYISTGGVIGS